METRGRGEGRKEGVREWGRERYINKVREVKERGVEERGPILKEEVEKRETCLTYEGERKEWGVGQEEGLQDLCRLLLLTGPTTWPFIRAAAAVPGCLAGNLKASECHVIYDASP